MKEGLLVPHALEEKEEEKYDIIKGRICKGKRGGISFWGKERRGMVALGDPWERDLTSCLLWTY